MNQLQFENGDLMPTLGLGTWKSAPGEVGAAVLEALRIGYRHIDCAAIYGNEAEIGEALERAFAEGIVTREQLWITSKLWCDRHAREDVEPALRETLAALRCDYLDLYLVHWPVAVRRGVKGSDDPQFFVSLDEQPLLETWRGMEDVVEAGLARHIGVSNYSSKRLHEHLGERITPEVVQVELHPYLQQPELFNFAREHGAHVTAYSPLGSADRPETMKARNEPVLLEDEGIESIAERHGATPAQVLIAWAIQRGTSVIPKSVNPERLAQNFAAAELELDDDAMEEIATFDQARRYVTGSFWQKPNSPYTMNWLWERA